VPKSAPPPLPDRPTITITRSDEDGTATPRTRPAQLLLPPPPHALVTSDSDSTVDSDSAGPGARSAAPSFLTHELPRSLDPDERQLRRSQSSPADGRRG
jgi:hypothetical protein